MICRVARLKPEYLVFAGMKLDLVNSKDHSRYLWVNCCVVHITALFCISLLCSISTGLL